MVQEYISTLQDQLEQCHADINKLKELKSRALEDPEEFIKFLKSIESRVVMPVPQAIQRSPNVPLDRYRLKLTRRSNSKFEQNLEYLLARLQQVNRQRPILDQPLFRSESTIVEARPASAPVKATFPDIRQSFLTVLDHPLPASIATPNVLPPTVHQPRPRQASRFNAAEPFASEYPRPLSVPVFSAPPTPGPSRSVTPKVASQSKQQKQRVRKASANAPENTSLTHNIPWSDDEKRKLDYLLTVYPEEEVQARRYAKISAALGSRTANQVASRVQKLQAKAARMKAKSEKAGNSIPEASTKTITPRVDDETRELVVQLESFFSASSDPGIKSTPEYAEYLRLKAQLEAIALDPLNGVIHAGYKCDSCGIDPLIGARWTCCSCPRSAPSIDLCDLCVSKGFETEIHKVSHVFKKIEIPEEVINDTADADFLFK